MRAIQSTAAVSFGGVPTLIMSLSSDALYPPYQQQALRDGLSVAGQMERAALELGWQCVRDGQNVTVYHPQGGTVTLTGDTVETQGFVGAGCHEARKALGIRVEEGSIHETAECAGAVAKVSVPA